MPTPFLPSCTFCASANDFSGQIGGIWDSRALGIRVRVEKAKQYPSSMPQLGAE